jgi:hypothetical protein
VSETIRIAMWWGPRNISTAMMRSFGARPDTSVIDEPFYAAYLAKTGLNHPMRDEVLKSQPQDWRRVVDTLSGDAPEGKSVFYQKHMTHHMLSEFGCDWMSRCRNAFLIRDPRAVLASYVAKRTEVELSDIGVVRQRELFEREADRIGKAPAVIDGADVLAAPARVLALLCSSLGITFVDSMLSWEAGRRSTDGVWAPAWYVAVEKTTGFERPALSMPPALTSDLERIAEAAMPHYEAIAMYKIR